MQIIRRSAYARAALAGNPSDGYGGKTLSMIVRNFHADVVLYEWPTLEVLPAREDHNKFESLAHLIDDVRQHGYYGGIRLVKATIKRFAEHCAGRYALHDRNFSVRYSSNIPRQVGLAGSSAIIVATLRALVDFYAVPIPQEVQPSLAMSVETAELDMAAGLQDRVIQVYEGLVFQDYSADAMHEVDGLRCGRYESLAPSLLPPLFLAYSTAYSKPIQTASNNLRTRFERGDAEVIEAIETLAGIADKARAAVLAGDSAELGRLMDANFDERRRILTLPAAHVRMVEVARSVGAAANFCGSGGAIIGYCPNETAFRRLADQLRETGCETIRPIV